MMMNRQFGLGANLSLAKKNGGIKRSLLVPVKSVSSLKDTIRRSANGITGRIQLAVRVCDKGVHEEGSRLNDAGHTRRPEVERSIFVEIERCHELNPSGLRQSLSPFVIIKLNGVEVGRTPALVKSKNKNPFWHDECYEFPSMKEQCWLSLEVWDMGYEPISFIGEGRIMVPNQMENSEDIREFDIDLKKWREDSLQVGSFNVQESYIPTSDTHYKSDDINTGHSRPSRGWTAGKGRKRILSLEKPMLKSSEQNKYKIDNPEPYRRRDIRELEERHSREPITSSTGFRACCLIVAYLSFGVLGYSFIFEFWSIRDSLYFSVVTFTTVGYGDIRPESDGGKLFSCFFALSGIGIIGIALGYIGQNLIQAQVSALQSSHQRNLKDEHLGEEAISLGLNEINEVPSENANDIQNNMIGGSTSGNQTFRQIFVLICPITVMIVLGSVVVGSTENWNWIDSVYWCVITGTTVGYGDLTPQSSQMRWFSIVFIPISVGVISTALGRVANIFVEQEIVKANKRLLQSELTLEDLENMNVDGDGEVSLLEFVEHMLKSMNKVDQQLLDELHNQFCKLDADGSGGLQKEDLDLLTERKLGERRNKALAKYKSTLLRKGSFVGRAKIAVSE